METVWCGGAKDLAYLVILGHNWKFFEEVVKGWSDAPVKKAELELEDQGRQWKPRWPRGGHKKVGAWRTNTLEEDHLHG